MLPSALYALSPCLVMAAVLFLASSFHPHFIQSNESIHLCRSDLLAILATDMDGRSRSSLQSSEPKNKKQFDFLSKNNNQRLSSISRISLLLLIRRHNLLTPPWLSVDSSPSSSVPPFAWEAA